ncbi:MAG: LytTR family DNA-binding domain-containing protein [Bacteroidales bacterium]|jgi:DNA-binding LytR/AlgR family response regulator|nr:LytTR family DNA-binding domain-containing protein [Bacteroidales bacterium]
MKINCIVIDDEHLAREYIKNYIAKIPQLALIGEFNSPLKAMDLIKSGDVDLRFLDIKMPELTSEDFLKSLKNAPEVIFTTAYQEYALEGFNLSVTDYLLKPFSFDRFFQGVNKVIDKIGKAKTKTEIPFPTLPETCIEDNYLTIRANRKFYKINFDDIIYIEGQKAYVTFYTEKKRITALASLKELEEALPPQQFIRIHKSYIVAKKSIASLEGNIIEIGENKLPVGKTHRDEVLKFFGIN